MDTAIEKEKEKEKEGRRRMRERRQRRRRMRERRTMDDECFASYLRDYFFGGMTTTGRSESINAFIKRFISSHTNLGQFVKQVDLAIEDIDQVQLHDTMLETYRGSSLRTMSPLEEQAHNVLTPYCFKKFQEQFGRAALYSLTHEDGHMFVLKYYEETWYNKWHNVLHVEKGQDLFLHAFYESLQLIQEHKLQVPSLHVVIVGSDITAQTKFESELRDLVAQKKIQNSVHFV
ncbi:hypothetical protein RHGRI_023678 [Rhododendron griersonianum]|uniref:Protein FAR1-RELATED SEQUENCE n=1 Tax=Rhododendron griersonianum TaxID=479676 RepID=A0AAV6J639_9ERIC|nr:hypothetical protein RHGRI_023678 [Rhododendron griersonianum]